MRRELLVAALLAFAGCSGLGGIAGESTPADAATPAPIPTEEPTAYPPGVSALGVNATALAAAHVRALRGDSYRYQFDRREARPEPGLGTVYVGPRVTVAVDGPRRYSVVHESVTERGGGLSVSTFVRGRYADGDRVVHYDGNRTRTRPVRANDTALGARRSAAYVATYLAVDEVDVRAFENGSALVSGDVTRAVDGVDYSVEALVGPDGVVRRFEALFVRDERVHFVAFSLTRESAPVTPPPWVNGTAA